MGIVLNDRVGIKEKIVSNLIQFSVVVFFGLSVVVKSGYSFGPAILLLIGSFFIFKKSAWLELPKEMKVVIAIFILYFFVQLVSIWIDGGKLRELDRTSRILMAVCIIPLLYIYKINSLSILIGVSLGAISSGFLGLYEKLWLGADRAFAIDAMPIQLGNISMMLGFFSLCGFFHVRNKSIKLSVLMMFAFFMGVLGSLLSGSRGGWILAPIIIVSIFYFFRYALNNFDKLIVVIGSVLILAMICIPQSGVTGRVMAAKNDIVQYTNGVEKNTSLGIRFQLWHSAWDAFIDRPFFGWGNHGLEKGLEQQVVHGETTEFIKDFFIDSHAHNQFLDEMAKRGIIGMGVLLVLFLLPFYIANKILSEHPLNAVLLIVLGSSMIDFSLSQAFISHNSGMTFYVICLIIFASFERGGKLSSERQKIA